MQALQGDGKAITADHADIQFDEADDDAVQLQKSAAVLFGFSGVCHERVLSRHTRTYHPCYRCAPACKLASM